MERFPSSQLDLDSAGILVANFLQSWWQAGYALPLTPQSKPSCHELQNPNPPSPEDGLRLPAPIHDGSSLPSSGEHPTPVCLERPSLGPGLATGSDPGVGCGPGPVGHADEQSPGFQDPGGRCVSGESGSRFCAGSFAAVALVQRLASVARDLLFNRHPDRRCRWVLRSGRFQRSAFAWAQRHPLTSRIAFYPRAPPRRQTPQGPARRTPFSATGGLCPWRGAWRCLIRSRYRGAKRGALGLHSLSPDRQCLRGGSTLLAAQFELSSARLRWPLEWQDHLGQAQSWPSPVFIEQSLLCRGLRFRPVSRSEIHLNRRPGPSQGATAANG